MDNIGSGNEESHEAVPDNNQSVTAGPSSTTLPPDWMMQLVQGFQAIAGGMLAPVRTLKAGGMKDF